MRRCRRAPATAVFEPAYKQHTAVDDVRGVILDVEVTTGEANEGGEIEGQADAVAATTGVAIKTITADQGYAYGKVYGALERRGIDPVIPAKKEPIRSRIPLRRFRYDARHDILRCPKGRILRPTRPIEHGRFFYSKAKDCRMCARCVDDCLSPGRVNKAVVVSDDHPALLRARRRKERWSEEDAQALPASPLALRGFSWRGEMLAWAGQSHPARPAEHARPVVFDGYGSQSQAARRRVGPDLERIIRAFSRFSGLAEPQVRKTSGNRLTGGHQDASDPGRTTDRIIQQPHPAALPG